MKWSTTRTRRVLRLAGTLVTANTLRAVFNELQEALRGHVTNENDPRARIMVVDARPPSVIHVNGYLKDVRRCVNRVMRRHRGCCECEVYPNRRSKRFITLVLRPATPEAARARFKDDGRAYFIDGPFRGREVVWSTRQQVDVDTLRDEVDKDKFKVQPDVWNNTLYGWKRENE